MADTLVVVDGVDSRKPINQSRLPPEVTVSSATATADPVAVVQTPDVVVLVVGQVLDAGRMAHRIRSSAALARAYLDGSAEVSRVLGDWWLVAWHRTSQEIVLHRPVLGHCAMFFSVSWPRVAVSNNLRLLLSLPWVDSRLSDSWVIRQLANYPSSVPAATPFEGVRLVPAAHRARLTRSEVSFIREWPDSRFGVPVPGSKREAVDALRTSFLAAVERICTGASEIASTLSAGLDSSAVTAAAVVTGKGRVTPFTHVPSVRLRSGSALADESPMADALSTVLGIPAPVRLGAGRLTPVEALAQRLALVGMPIGAARNACWALDLVRVVRARGFDVLLTGQMGNLVWSYAGTMRPSWTDLVRYGHYTAAVRRAMPAWLRRRHRLAAIPAPLRPRARCGISPIHPGREQDTELLRLRRDGHDPFWISTPAEAQVQQITRIGTTVSLAWNRCASSIGLRVGDPSSDVDLLDTVHSIPDQWWSDWSRGAVGSRWLFREAVRDLLPTETRRRTIRGVQAADTCFRLALGSQELFATLAEVGSSTAARHYLDLDYLRRVAEATVDAPDKVPLPIADDVLLQGLEIAMFLRGVETGWALQAGFKLTEALCSTAVPGGEK